MGLSNKQAAWVEYYLQTWNATEAARRAGYKDPEVSGWENKQKPEIEAEIKRRLEALTMSESEILTRLTEHARGDMGVFFKIIEEWTEFPLETHEIIDAKEVIEKDERGEEVKHTYYWVRHVAVDMDRLLDPTYSRLVRKFKDSPKDGISIELHDAQGALKLLGQKYGLFKDKVEVSGNSGGPLVINLSWGDSEPGA